MRLDRTSLGIVAIGILSAIAFGAATSAPTMRNAGSASATRGTASLPTTRSAATLDSGPRGALLAQVEGEYAGDLKTVLSCFWFADAKSREAWETRLGETIANQHFRQAMTAVFGEEDTSPFAMLSTYQAGRYNDLVGMSAAQLETRKQTLARADLKMEGETAVLTITLVPPAQPADVFYLIKKDGAWKIDADKTQPKMRDLTPAQLNQWKKLQADVDTLAADVKAKKYSRREDAWDRYYAIQDNVLKAGTATKP